MYMKTKTASESIKLCQLITGRAIGATFIVVEPEYVAEIHETPLITTETSLIPCDYNMMTAIQSSINEGIVNQDKKVSSFLMLCKPEFKRAGLIDDMCGNDFCDGLHTIDLNKKCPAITGTAPRQTVMTVRISIAGVSESLRCNSRSLAQYFVGKSFLCVSTYAKL